MEVSRVALELSAFPHLKGRRQLKDIVAWRTRRCRVQLGGGVKKMDNVKIFKGRLEEEGP
jgi:hypothetical protein